MRFRQLAACCLISGTVLIGALAQSSAAATTDSTQPLWKTAVASEPSGQGTLELVTAACQFCNPTELILTRVRANGTVDPSFGDSGEARFHLPGRPALIPTGVALDSNRQAIIVGSYTGGTGEDEDRGSFAARFTESGKPDASFGMNGVLLTPASSFFHYGSISQGGGVALDSAGRILIAGRDGLHPGQPAVMRLTPSGEPDPDFGSDGIVAPTISGISGGEYSTVSILPSGTIVLGGQNEGGGSDGLALVTELDPTGAPDPDFGSGGTASPPGRVGADSNRVVSVFAGADGELRVLTTQTYFDEHSCYFTRVSALTAEGQLDPNYGQQGQTFLGNDCFVPRGASLDSRGRLIAIGSKDDILLSKVAAVRIGLSGEIQSSFASGARYRVLRLSDHGSSGATITDGPGSSMIVGGYVGAESCPELKGKPSCQRAFAGKLRASGDLAKSFGKSGVGWLAIGL